MVGLIQKGTSRLGTCCSSEEALLHINALLASAGSSISAEYAGAHSCIPIGGDLKWWLYVGLNQSNLIVFTCRMAAFYEDNMYDYSSSKY